MTSNNVPEKTMIENLSSQVSFSDHVCLPCAVTKEIELVKTFKVALKKRLHRLLFN